MLSPNVVWGETVKSGSLVKREGQYFKKFTNVPFNGEVTGKDQGKLEKGERVCGSVTLRMEWFILSETTRAVRKTARG